MDSNNTYMNTNSSNEPNLREETKDQKINSDATEKGQKNHQEHESNKKELEPKVSLVNSSHILPQYWQPAGTVSNEVLQPQHSYKKPKYVPYDIDEEGKVQLKKVSSMEETAALYMNRIVNESLVPFQEVKKGTNLFEKEEIEESNDAKKNEIKEGEGEQGKVTREVFDSRRELVAERIWHTYNEADSLLNLMNVLLNNPHINPDNLGNHTIQANQPLQPLLDTPAVLDFNLTQTNSLTNRQKVDNLRLQLTAKKQQVDSVSQLLKENTERLRARVALEKEYWKVVCELRDLGWVVQSVPTKRGPKLVRPCFVNYGLNLFKGKVNHAYLDKDDSCDGNLRVELPVNHRFNKVVIVRTFKPNTDLAIMTDLKNLDKDLLNGFLKGNKVMQELDGNNLHKVTIATHTKLRRAQNTSRQLDLFEFLRNEAQTLDSVIQLDNSSIIIQLEDSTYLQVALVSYDTESCNDGNEINGDITESATANDEEIQLLVRLKQILLARFLIFFQRKDELRIQKLTANLPQVPLEHGIETKVLKKPIFPDGLQLISKVTLYERFKDKIFKLAKQTLDLQQPTSTDYTDPKNNNTPYKFELNLVPLPNQRIGSFLTQHILLIESDGLFTVKFLIRAPNLIWKCCNKGQTKMDAASFQKVLLMELSRLKD